MCGLRGQQGTLSGSAEWPLGFDTAGRGQLGSSGVPGSGAGQCHTHLRFRVYTALGRPVQATRQALCAQHLPSGSRGPRTVSTQTSGRRGGVGGPSWISSEDERAQGGQPGPRPRTSYAVGRGPTPDPEAARFLTTEAEPGPAPCRGLLCYPRGARGPCCWGRWRSRGAPRTRVPSPCRGAALCCPDLANGCGPKRLSPSLASRLVPLHFACGRGRGGAWGDPGLPLGPRGGGRVLGTPDSVLYPLGLVPRSESREHRPSHPLLPFGLRPFSAAHHSRMTP